jgi:uncharacterized HAD superfamily protein/hypoxanthine phosphoribosyltransferase
MTASLQRKKVNFKSVDDLNALIIRTLPDLHSDIDLIVAVPRSGYLVASLIALNLNRPLCAYNEFLGNRIPMGGRRTAEFKCNPSQRKNVLIVDDSVSSGWEMRRIQAQVEAANLNHNISYLAAYVKGGAKELVDYALEIIEPPQMFEWNLYHHPHLIRCCIDIDGVLCRDATQDEDDDGPNYLTFLVTAKPRIIPSVRLGQLVTSRLEKYRPETEAWLKKHRVQYDELIMQDQPDLATRRRLGCDAKFKADVYNRSDNFLFIESSAWQASEIARLTHKAVFCTDERTFIQAKTLDGPHWDSVRTATAAAGQAPHRLLSLLGKVKKKLFT